MIKFLTVVTMFVNLCYLIFPRNAYAYIDMGTGSYIFSMGIAVLLGGLYYIKVYWQKIKTFFTYLLFQKREKNETSDK